MFSVQLSLTGVAESSFQSPCVVSMSTADVCDCYHCVCEAGELLTLCIFKQCFSLWGSQMSPFCGLKMSKKECSYQVYVRMYLQTVFGQGHSTFLDDLLNSLYWQVTSCLLQTLTEESNHLRDTRLRHHHGNITAPQHLNRRHAYCTLHKWVQW